MSANGGAENGQGSYYGRLRAKLDSRGESQGVAMRRMIVSGSDEHGEVLLGMLAVVEAVHGLRSAIVEAVQAFREGGDRDAGS